MAKAIEITGPQIFRLRVLESARPYAKDSALAGNPTAKMSFTTLRFGLKSLIENNRKRNSGSMHSIFHAAIVKQSCALHYLSDLVHKYLLHDVVINCNHGLAKLNHIKSSLLVKLNHSAMHDRHCRKTVMKTTCCILDHMSSGRKNTMRSSASW